MPAMFKSRSTSMILLGVLAIIAGIVALAWPGITILVLVIMFAIYAFSDAVLQGARAFSAGGPPPRRLTRNGRLPPTRNQLCSASATSGQQ
jgi:uncharacterized membrane protein HdeD (DUF308 family)